MAHLSDTSRGKTASILDFLVTIGAAALFFVYLTLAIYTKDARWFWPFYSAEPSYAVLRCYGSEVTLDGAWPETKQIATLVNGQISGEKRWDELNLTDLTYEYYQTSPLMVVLELHYSEPQRIHSQSPFFSDFETLMIPLDGRFSETEIIFNLVNGKPAGGSFHVKSFDPLREYLESEGLCSIKS